jgi:hypothetical protein
MPSLTRNAVAGTANAHANLSAPVSSPSSRPANPYYQLTGSKQRGSPKMHIWDRMSAHITQLCLPIPGRQYKRDENSKSSMSSMQKSARDIRSKRLRKHRSETATMSMCPAHTGIPSTIPGLLLYHIMQMQARVNMQMLMLRVRVVVRLERVAIVQV